MTATWLDVISNIEVDVLLGRQLTYYFSPIYRVDVLEIYLRIEISCQS